MKNFQLFNIVSSYLHFEIMMMQLDCRAERYEIFAAAVSSVEIVGNSGSGTNNKKMTENYDKTSECFVYFVNNLSSEHKQKIIQL